MQAESDRPWVVGVKRKLQTTESILALAGLAFLDGAVTAGGALVFNIITPALSVLCQRSMRKR